MKPPVRHSISFGLEGLQIASLEDATYSTGATLFFFPRGALAQADLRGGSVATSETSLLEEGSYSAVIDGIVFAGGSTMGLAAGDGVRDALFRRRSSPEKGASFDAIPSVPTAVVYDYSGRVGEERDRLVYPDRELGRALMNHLSADTFFAGRAGAGVSTTANKISSRVWGGQGLASRDLGYANVVAAVALNPLGNVLLPALKPIVGETPVARPGQNTTLSIVITDAQLTRTELKRLAIAAHSSMARLIHPFHTASDGDVLFAVSCGARAIARDQHMSLTVAAGDTLLEAIRVSAQIANG